MIVNSGIQTHSPKASLAHDCQFRIQGGSADIDIDDVEGQDVFRRDQVTGLPSLRIRCLTSALPSALPSCQLPIGLSTGVMLLP